MKDQYIKTDAVDLGRFYRGLVNGFFGEAAADYWHGWDTLTDELIHLTPSGKWCVIRKLNSYGLLPAKPKDTYLREIE